MAEYAKKKNDELAALCKERGLAHTGKKAELVKRLEEHDASSAAAPAAGAAANEDEIDWDEEPAAEPINAASIEPAVPAVDIADAPVVPEQSSAVDSAATADPTTTAAPTDAAPAEKPEVDFSTGLAARTLDEEIEKRKARARKFGLPEDTEEIKALERAKRFGNSEEIPGLGLLNRALPTKQDRKRGGEVSDSDGGIRKQGRGRGPKGKVQGSGPKPKPAAGAKPAAGGKPAAGNGGFPGWMTEKDREAAAKRKARFAAAT